MTWVAFYTFAVMTLGAAFCVVTFRNVLHSALMLGVSLLGVSGIFALLGADFVFASQILIYVGGINVLVLFVVLLAARHSDLVLRQSNAQWLAALLVCGVTLFGLLRGLKAYRSVTLAAGPEPGTAKIARLLLTDLAVPFELISLVLLAALVGAILFSRAEAE